MKRIFKITTIVFALLTVLLVFASCEDVKNIIDGNKEHVHDYDDWITVKEPTCTTAGEMARYCDCGEKQVETRPAVGHSYVDGVCSVCSDKQIADGNTPGDNEGGDTPGGDEGGDPEEDKKCKHANISVEIVENRETEVPTYGVRCLGCGETVIPAENSAEGGEDETEAEKCPHTEIPMELVEGKAPTCYSDGLTYGVKCLDCSEMIISQNSIPAAHTYDGLVCVSCGQIKKENLVYDSDEAVYFINVSSSSANVYNFTNSVLKEIRDRGYEASLCYDTVEVKNQEIAVGVCDRNVSRLLYERLEERAPSDGEMFFAAYSDGKSIALAFGGPEGYDSYLLAFAEESFFEFCVNDDGKISILADEFFIATTDAEEYEKKADAAAREKAWADIESTHGAESATALKALYSLYSADTVTWLAKLYDAQIGGFYYSNSARDTAGYLPDLESTAQALDILVNTGMVESTSALKTALPESMQKQLVYFVKNLQDAENGFFYHPQWSRDLVDSNVARRARDLARATSILEYFGASPTYDTPYGMEGDGIRADGTPVSASALTAPIGGSAVLAVSKVISVSVYPPYLQSEEAFLAYLESLNFDDNTYSAANTLSVQYNEIKNAELNDVLIQWLNEHQVGETGLWGNYETVTRECIGALLKIANIYSNDKSPIPNSTLVAAATVDFVCSDAETTIVVDIYNAWYVLRSIRQNLISYGNRDDVTAIAEDLKEKAPELMDKTAAKLRKYLKADGSFSYYEDRTAHTAQGVPVSVENVNEGDVNATGIAISTLNYVKEVLGYNNAPSLFGKSEFAAFLKEIDAQ